MLRSTAGAAEHQGDLLGEFVEAGEYGGRPYYRQRDTERKKDAFLYSKGGEWLVSETLGGSDVNLVNPQNSFKPPYDQWLYWDGNKFNANDTSLTLEFTTLSPCQLLRVEGKDDWRLQVIEDYRSVYIIMLNIMKSIKYNHPNS